MAATVAIQISAADFGYGIGWLLCGLAGEAALFLSNPESIDEMERPSSRISPCLDPQKFHFDNISGSVSRQTTVLIDRE